MIELDNIVDDQALKRFKQKYDEKIINTANEAYISSLSPSKSTDIVGTKALQQLTGGLSFAQDENGRWGYRVGIDGEIMPFTKNGYNGFHGILWLSGYAPTTSWGTTPPGISLINDQTDIVEQVVTEDNGVYYTAFRVYEGCRLKFTSFSNTGTGSSSGITTRFKVRDWRNGTVIETNKNMNATTINCQGYEEFILFGPLRNSASTVLDRGNFFGGWTIEIVAVNSDYVYKPERVNALVFDYYYSGGDGKDKDVSSTMYIDGVDRSSKMYVISSAYGATSGYTNGSSCGIYLNGDSIGGSTIHQITNGNSVNVKATVNYFGRAWAHALVFKMPTSSMEGKSPTLIKTLGRSVKNSNETVTENYKDSWTIEGLTPGRNAFVMWTGSGSTYVNGISLSSSRAKLVRNGDVIIKYLTVPPGGRPTSGYAYVFEI